MQWTSVARPSRARFPEADRVPMNPRTARCIDDQINSALSALRVGGWMRSVAQCHVSEAVILGTVQYYAASTRRVSAWGFEYGK